MIVIPRIDHYGKSVITIQFKHVSGFTIATENNLPKTHQNIISGIPINIPITIGEIELYVAEHGTRLQQYKLDIY